MIYDVIIDYRYEEEGKTLEEVAIDFLTGFDFSETELVEDNITHRHFITEHNGVNLYYDYAGDYYFFTE